MATQIAVPQSGQLPEQKGPEMNDRDRINDLLTFEKYLSNGYNVGLHEAQNPKLHTQIQNNLLEVQTAGHKIFNLMFQKGWYKMIQADTAEVNKAHTQFTNYRTQFPF